MNNSVVSNRPIDPAGKEGAGYAFPASVRLLTQASLANQFIVQLGKRLALTPGPQLYRQLVDVYRRVGDLEMATKTAAEWLSFAQSDTQAAHMSCILNQQKPRGDCYLPDQLQPAPFVIFDNFLAQEERDCFWQTAMGSKEAFFDAGIRCNNGRTIDHDRRISSTLALGKADKDLFYQKIQPRLDELRSLFLMPKMSYKKMEIKMTAHSQGGFFNIHQDGFTDVQGSTRHLSWLYYFHLQPKRYSGGDLILFDSTRVLKTHRFHEEKYTRYIPVDNQLVCFPSYFYHGVTPVELLQPGFESNRFAISGHICY